MIVVSDTTIITTLLKAGELGFLQKMFREVVVPKAVWEELMAFHTELPSFVVCRSITAAGKFAQDAQKLGRGEMEAIELAKELRADLLLTDDRKARRVAADAGLRCTGLMGLVVKAKRSGQLTTVRDFIGILETRGGLYLSEAIKTEVLTLAGEYR